MGGLSAEDDHEGGHQSAEDDPLTPPRPGALQPPRAPVFCDQKRWPCALLHVAAPATKANPSFVCINCAKMRLFLSVAINTLFSFALQSPSSSLPGSQRRGSYNRSALGTLLVSPATRSAINLHCSFKTLSFNLVLPLSPPQLTDLLVYIS